MGGKERAVAGSMLLAICFLAGGATHAPVHAMEPAQSSATSFPSFLADDHVAILQEAWRTSGPVSSEARSRHGDMILFGAPLVADDPMDAARAVMQRAKLPGRDEATVRRHAEELSRRFGAGRETSAAAESVAAKETLPAVATSAVVPPEHPLDAKGSDAKEQVAAALEPPIRKVIAAEPEMVVTTGTLAPVPEVQALDASVRTQSATPAQRLRLAAPPPSSDALPPLPKRAPKERKSAAVAPTWPAPAAVVHLRPARPYVGRQDPQPDPLAALRGTVLTNELRAFGWNSQPR